MSFVPRLPARALHAFALLPLLVARDSAPAGVVFGPVPGARVAKTCSVELELGIESWRATLDGQPIAQEAVDESGTLLVRLDVAATDVYGASDGGRPLELARTYARLELSGEAGSGSAHRDASVAELADETVRFAWDAEKHAYATTLAGRDVKGDALAGLFDDLDARCLLPREKVAPGDEWKVTGPGLDALVVPGGLPGLGVPGGADALPRVFFGQLARGVRGLAFECTAKGPRADDANVFEITFTFEGDVALDLAELVTALDPDRAGALHDLETRTKLHLTGAGTLAWDLAARRARSFTCDAKLRVDADVRATVPLDGRDHAAVATVVLGGRGRWEWTAKAVE